MTTIPDLFVSDYNLDLSLGVPFIKWTYSLILYSGLSLKYNLYFYIHERYGSIFYPQKTFLVNASLFYSSLFVKSFQILKKLSLFRHPFFIL